MAVVAGFVEKIKYRNEENGYSVLDVSGEGEEYILVGNFPVISEGEYIRAEGSMKVHPVYGEQLAVETYEIRTPEDSVGVERYLSSGAVKGVGETLARRIADRCLVLDGRVAAATVCVHKPQAPVGVVLTDVAVTIRRERHDVD